MFIQSVTLKLKLTAEVSLACGLFGSWPFWPVVFMAGCPFHYQPFHFCGLSSNLNTVGLRNSRNLITNVFTQSLKLPRGKIPVGIECRAFSSDIETSKFDKLKNLSGKKGQFHAKASTILNPA